jgi:hypothetical protein
MARRARSPEGMLYADNPDFNRQELHKLAAVTPQQVRAAMQRWLMRPVYALRVDQAHAKAYVEAPATQAVEPAASPAEVSAHHTAPNAAGGRGLQA